MKEKENLVAETHQNVSRLIDKEEEGEFYIELMQDKLKLKYL